MGIKYSLHGKTNGATSLSGKTNSSASLSPKMDEGEKLSGQTEKKESLSGNTNEESSLNGDINYGDKGDPGDSAYEVAVKNGFEGTEAEWLSSLKGKDGSTPYIIDGYWYIDGKNTHIKAEGDNGKDYILTAADIIKIAKQASDNIDISSFQTKTDKGLETTSKDIVGAINELASDGSIQTWVLYDDLERASGFDYEFNFISNGVSYIGMTGTIDRTIDSMGHIYECFRVVYNKSDGSGKEVYDGFVSFWKDTAYQTIVTTDTEVYEKYQGRISISEALDCVANKKPTGLNTKSQTLVGAINEVNEKIVENADSFEEQVSKTNFGKWISNFVGNAVDFVTALIDKIKDTITTAEIDAIEVEKSERATLTSTKTVVGAINELNYKINNIDPPEIDTSGLKTEDKTLVGAINEVNARANDAMGHIQSIEDGYIKVGESEYADKLSNARKITFTGDVSGEVTFDGAEDKSVAITVLNGGGGTNIVVDNLAGTTWYLNETLTIPKSALYKLDFTCPNEEHSGLTFYYNSITVNGVKQSAIVYTGNSHNSYRSVDGWLNQDYRTITITDGTDATNTELISWLYSNGKLVSWDTSILETVDKISGIGFSSGGISDMYIEDDGVHFAYEETEIATSFGNYHYVNGITTNIPIVAGNNIEFEVDEANQVVKINATGGGSSSDDSIVGTWVFNDEITMPSKVFEVSFNNWGCEYTAMDIGSDGLFYSEAVGDYSEPVYYLPDNCWNNEEYKSITITQEPTDTEFITWLKANAEKQGDIPKEEMPQIRFTNAAYTNDYKIVNEDSPLKLTVEIVGGGALQVGDLLQICARRTYGYRKNALPYRKQKLRRQQQYVITEEDLDKRFLTIATDDSVYGWLFKNDRNSKVEGMGGLEIDTLSPFYLRIKRVTKYSDGGVECDAIFSNVVTVWKTYNYQTGKVNIK